MELDFSLRFRNKMRKIGHKVYFKSCKYKIIKWYFSSILDSVANASLTAASPDNLDNLHKLDIDR